MVALLLQSLFSLLQRHWKLLLRSLLAAHQDVVGTYHTLHTLALLYPPFTHSLQVTTKTKLLAASSQQLKMGTRKKILPPTNVTRTQRNKT